MIKFVLCIILIIQFACLAYLCRCAKKNIFVWPAITWLLTLAFGAFAILYVEPNTPITPQQETKEVPQQILRLKGPKYYVNNVVYTVDEERYIF